MDRLVPALQFSTLNIDITIVYCQNMIISCGVNNTRPRIHDIGQMNISYRIGDFSVGSEEYCNSTIKAATSSEESDPRE